MGQSSSSGRALQPPAAAEAQPGRAPRVQAKRQQKREEVRSPDAARRRRRRLLLLLIPAVQQQLAAPHSFSFLCLPSFYSSRRSYRRSFLVLSLQEVVKPQIRRRGYLPYYHLIRLVWTRVRGREMKEVLRRLIGNSGGGYARSVVGCWIFWLHHAGRISRLSRRYSSGSFSDRVSL